MAKITLYPSDDFTTLDLLLFRYFKREYDGLVEQTLAGNPGLAALGVFIPRGTPVVVLVPSETTRTPKPLISLWSKAT